MSDLNNDLNQDKNDEEIYNLIMDKITFSRNRIKINICMVFFFMADGVEMRVFNLIIKPFGQYYDLEETSFAIQFAASSIFLGIIIGSASASLLTKKFGRILTINVLNLIFFLCFFLRGLWMSYQVFIIFRIIIGITIGVIIPIFLNIYGEYAPTKYRGLLLMITWSVFGVGATISSSLGLVILPELQKDKVQMYLLILTIFPFLGFISCLFLLRDSPRGLLLSKKINESTSKQTSNEVKLINLIPEQEEEQQIEEKTTTTNTNESYSTKELIKEMFNAQYKKTTILMIFNFIFIGYNAFGIYSISSYFMDYLDEKENGKKGEERETPARDIIINQTLYAVADIVSNVIGGFFGEIRKLGRKGGIIVTLIVSSIFTIIGLFKKILFEITSPFALGISGIYVNLMMDYVVELYPTKIRDTSTSLLFLVYRISCFTCNFISLGFYDIHAFIPYIIFVVFSVLTFFSTWALPYEMAGKAIQ